MTQKYYNEAKNRTIKWQKETIQSLNHKLQISKAENVAKNYVLLCIAIIYIITKFFI